MYKKVFSFSGKDSYKDSYKLLIMNRVLCSDEFFIKRLILEKKRKKERMKELYYYKDDTLEMKSKLYLRITLITLINYMMEKNLFAKNLFPFRS